MLADLLLQLPHLGIGQCLQPAAPESRRQRNRAEADPHQPRHGQPDRIEQPAHLAVATFQDHHPVPVVGPIVVTTDVLDGLQRGRPVFQHHAGQQLRTDGIVHPAQHPDRILAFPAIARVHQPVGQIPGRGENQQPLTVEVQPAHGNPARAAQPRQTVEHLRPRPRIVTRDQLACGLVIEQHLRLLRGRSGPLACQRLAVDADHVLRPHPLADMGRQAIDRHPAGNDQIFHVAARADARIRQNLVQFLGPRRRRTTSALQADGRLPGEERHGVRVGRTVVVILILVVPVVIPGFQGVDAIEGIVLVFVVVVVPVAGGRITTVQIQCDLFARPAAGRSPAHPSGFATGCIIGHTRNDAMPGRIILARLMGRMCRMCRVRCRRRFRCIRRVRCLRCIRSVRCLRHIHRIRRSSAARNLRQHVGFCQRGHGRIPVHGSCRGRFGASLRPGRRLARRSTPRTGTGSGRPARFAGRRSTVGRFRRGGALRAGSPCSLCNGIGRRTGIDLHAGISLRADPLLNRGRGRATVRRLRPGGLSRFTGCSRRRIGRPATGPRRATGRFGRRFGHGFPAAGSRIRRSRACGNAGRCLPFRRLTGGHLRGIGIHRRHGGLPAGTGCPATRRGRCLFRGRSPGCRLCGRIGSHRTAAAAG